MIASVLVAIEGIVAAGFRETIESVLGLGLGPLSIPLAVVIVLLSLWVVKQYLEEVSAE